MVLKNYLNVGAKVIKLFILFHATHKKQKYVFRLNKKLKRILKKRNKKVFLQKNS